MIQIIGLMVGAYIFTRMVEILANTDTKRVVAVCAVITVLVVAFCVFMLLTAGNQRPPLV